MLVLSKFMIFVLGCIHSLPQPHAARELRMLGRGKGWMGSCRAQCCVCSAWERVFLDLWAEDLPLQRALAQHLPRVTHLCQLLLKAFLSAFEAPWRTAMLAWIPKILIMEKPDC